MNVIIVVKLILAHALTDFVFQPNSWVEKKQKKILGTPVFWYHILIAAGLSYLFVADWKNWQIPLAIFVSHGIIDAFKLLLENKTQKSLDAANQIEDNSEEDKNKTIESLQQKLTWLFIVDQIAHIAVIVAIGLCMNQNLEEIKGWFNTIFQSSNDLIIVITAVILLLNPTGIVIGKITESFRAQFQSNDSLKKAGRYIGNFERLLILIFILSNQFEAVGFLLAGKSILRISIDSDDDGRKKSEYVLVGTLISFFSAIIVGLICQYLLNNM